MSDTAKTTDPVAEALREWLHVSNAEQRAAELRGFLARHGLVIVPGRVFKSFPESPDTVNVREFLRGLDAAFERTHPVVEVLPDA